MTVKPKKYLGQHFLIDDEVSQNIFKSITISENDNLIEIGPGTGALTKFLMTKNFNLKAFEIDNESVTYLKHNLPNLNLFQGDALKANWTNMFNNESFSVVGNFPYNISSQILFKIYENKNLVTQMVGMFQKEVAERVCSGPGTKKYGILSVLLQTFYKVEYLFTVSENAFNPAPKIKSGVIRLERNNIQKLDCDEKLFFNVVKSIFNQRRKMVRNSLKPYLQGLDLNHVLFAQRPEQLSVNDFFTITKLIESTNYKRVTT